MFVAYHTAGDLATDGIDGWMAEAWPSASKSEAHGWIIWSDGRPHQQPFVGEDRSVIVDGVIWHAKATWGQGLSETLGCDLEESWPLAPSWDGSFAVASLSHGQAIVGIEASGLRKCYWGFGNSGGIVVSSLQVPLAIGIGAKPDLAGVAEALSLGGTLGTRTLFDGCHEVWPGTCVRIADGRAEIFGGLDAALYPSGAEERTNWTVKEAADFLIPVLRNSAAMAFDSFERPAIALSGGTDSRLALGALLPERLPSNAYSYGDPADADVSVARRVARLAGIEHHTVDIRGRLFVGLDDVQRDVLRCEATWHPAWLSVSPALEAQGHDVLLMGDITDSLQVRVTALWGRKERVRRQIRQLVGRESQETQIPVEEWWDSYRRLTIQRVSSGAERFEISIPSAELAAAVDKDLAEIWDTAGLGAFESALDAEDAIQISVARHLAGSQANAVGGGAIGLSVFGTRAAVKAARSVGLSIRADRALLRELSLRMLPPELGKLPTATIPVISSTAPLPLQNAMWLARFSGDWVLRRANKVVGGRLPRERLIKSQELPAEYQSAGSDFFLGQDWTSSQAFNPRSLTHQFRRMVAGEQVPMYPMDQYTAVRIDTMLAPVSGLDGYSKES